MKTKQKLLSYIENNRLYLDGAMGSALIEKGYNTGDAELLNISHPDVIKEIHTSYLESGSKLILTNTFGANSHKIKSNNLREIITNGVLLACQAAEPYNAYVAYDAGPIGQMLFPFSELTQSMAYNIFKEQAEIIKDLPLDCIIIETITDLAEMRMAYLAFRENTDFPIFCSMSFQEDKRTFMGTHITSFALTMQGLGADAIGINCSIGPDKMIPVIKELVKCAHNPVFIKPNAGLPHLKEGKAVYDIGALDFSLYMKEIAELNVSILGGCCGTTPMYIKELIEKTESIKFKKFNNKIDAVCSSSSVVYFNKHLKVGERINPTGKPLLKQAITEDNHEYINMLCLEQAEDGADILDINAGMANIDESKKVEEIINNLQHIIQLPLQIDSTKADVIENALRAYNGVAIINSVIAESSSFSKIFKIAKKYGAYIIGLPLNDNGIPNNAIERVRLAKYIIDEAKKAGIGQDKIIIDGITMAISVDSNNAIITLETVKLLKKELGVKTVLGLSNVSFGLCNRDIINSSFYAQALEAGVDMVIINPKIQPEKDFYALEVLCGRDKNCQNYIERYQGARNNLKEESSLSIYNCILQGQSKKGIELIKEKIETEEYTTVIDNHIIPALNELGDKYDKKIIFLPELIAGADCASVMLNYIKEKNYKETDSSTEVMLIATVKGDIHDIGKNIVKVVLSNYGYKIIDLGKDVSTEKIIEAIKEYNPRYIGLSALMTTTVSNMKDSITDIKKMYPDIIFLVGGAVLSDDFAKSIAPDIIYCANPQSAVNVMKSYLK